MTDEERHALQIMYSRMYVLWRYCPDVTRQKHYAPILYRARRKFLRAGLTRNDLRKVQEICEGNMERYDEMLRNL